MKKQTMTLAGIPAILYGSRSRNVYLYLHGKNGCKEEAERFAATACEAGWQVLAIDLPEHGALMVICSTSLFWDALLCVNVFMLIINRFHPSRKMRFSRFIPNAFLFFWQLCTKDGFFLRSRALQTVRLRPCSMHARQAPAARPPTER